MFTRSLQSRYHKGLSYYFPLATRGVIDLKNYSQRTNDPQVMTNTGVVARGTGPSAEIPDAAVFVAASSQRLDFADNDRLSIVGDTTWEGWVYLEDKPASLRGFVDKWTGTGNQREWYIGHRNTDDRFSFFISADGTATGTSAIANIFGAPTVQTWYYIAAQYISGPRLLRISVNGGPFNTATLTGSSPPFTGTGTGGFGNNFIAGIYFSGKLADWVKHERILSDAEIRWRYNGGRGRRALPLA